ncbi:MAG: isoprenyl transferase [Bacteroidetes bacterium]|nr:isoprenyl transferase [Bacteroidota bacterium]
MENNIPQHIAIIMDGNGRWAKGKGHKRLYGHFNAITSVKEVIKGSVEKGVKYLTLYAFSTENWGRPKDEVDGLMGLFCKTVAKEIDELNVKGVKMRFMGDFSMLSESVRKTMNSSVEKTSKNDTLEVIIALSYSSRDEISNMVRKIAEKAKKGDINIDDINNDEIRNNLYLSDIPDPDLLIRTSGEQRISNFLLWQLAYTELYFTPVLWPDFRRKNLFEAIEEYANRSRRYGLVNKE